MTERPAPQRVVVLTTPADEPSVDELCRAAVALALAEPERAQSFVRRARMAGWLPELRFMVHRRFARTEGVTLDGSQLGLPAPVDVDAVDDVRYEWRATVDLSRMMFNPDELQAHFEALRMADVRREIQSLVIRLFFERRRLRLDIARGTGLSAPGAVDSGVAGDVDPTVRRQVRVLEIEAQLDALSGGAFYGAGARPDLQRHDSDRRSPATAGAR